MSDNIQKNLEWVISEIQKWTNYHDHKETMAWAATAFYMTSIVTFGFVLFNAQTIAKVLATIGILTVGYLVWIFVNMQFNMRWIAEDYQKGLMKFVAYLCSKEAELPERLEYYNKEDKFPKYIWNYIAEAKTCRNKKREAVKQLLSLNSKLDSRWKTELPSYGFIILATVIAILSLWINCL